MNKIFKASDDCNGGLTGLCRPVGCPSRNQLHSSGGGRSRAGKQLVVYMQMGGTAGDASTLARTNGARAAAASA